MVGVNNLVKDRVTFTGYEDPGMKVKNAPDKVGVKCHSVDKETCWIKIQNFFAKCFGWSQIIGFKLDDGKVYFINRFSLDNYLVRCGVSKKDAAAYDYSTTDRATKLGEALEAAKAKIAARRAGGETITTPEIPPQVDNTKSDPEARGASLHNQDALDAIAQDNAANKK